jgi:pimeloyl-ACP methyl ester carboxylesterase
MFVHGFRSSVATWTPLVTLLKQDETVTATFDLQMFDYETGLAPMPIVGRLPTLEEAGKALAARLETELITQEGNDRYIDVTLVGHSMGGLIIQSALLALLTPKGSTRVVDHVRQVILFATPNFGSTTLSAFRRLAGLVIRNPQEQALRLFSDEGIRIHDAVRDRIITARSRARDEYPIPFYCFSGRTDNIVRPESALGHFLAGEPLPGSHSSVHCPQATTDPAYQQFVRALQHPHGHSNVWEIERFSMHVKVSPLPAETAVTAQHGGKQRTVICDNVAAVTRKVLFSVNNGCRDPYILRYGTRNGGWIVPRMSQPHITSPDKLRVYDDTGMDAYYEVEPTAGSTSQLQLQVYKGFDAGHRDYHMHLGRRSYYRRVVFEVDLADYRRDGWTIIEPQLYFHPKDQDDHSLCAQRTLTHPDPANEVDASGIWRWHLEYVKEGVVDIAWDVQPPAYVGRDATGPAGAQHAKADAAPPVIRLRAGEHALFGYGSLLSIASLERTLGRRYEGPFVTCALAGWRRRWNVAMPNNTFVYRDDGCWVTPERILYLNVEPRGSDAVNGILFVVNDDDLARFDAREWIYDRVDVTSALRGAAVDGGTLWVYRGKAEHLLEQPSSPRTGAIRRTYLDILNDGHRALGDQFTRRYNDTTDPVPPALVVDDVRRDDV